MQLLLLPPFHALGNGILMAAGESRKHQSTRIGRPLIHMHPGAALINLHNGRKIGKVQPGIYAVGIHIQRQGDNIHIAGSLAIAKEGAFHPVGTGQQRQLCIGYTGAPVVVGVQGKGHIGAVLQILADVFYLAGVYMGQAHLHRYRQIDDHVIGFTGFQHIQNRVAYLQRVLRLGSGEAFGRILKTEIALILLCQTLDKPCALHSDFLDLLLALAEHLLPLGNTGGIVKMNDGTGGTLAGLEGFADDMLPALGQHLHRHILRNHLFLDQGPQKGVFRLRGRGEAHLDLFKSNLQQHPVEVQLLFQAHGNHQALVAVPQVHTAPCGSLLDMIPLHPLVMGSGGGIIPCRVLCCVHVLFLLFG